MPRYRAKTPPSVLYMVVRVGHIPGNFLPDLAFCNPANEADWMESRVRTISRGYVNVTEVIPAMAPHERR